ncbi:HAD hydrolase family protein [bacterium]|nr:HAD hydrolase family protein [bacterium]MBP5783086.1 HAD hydrolase family protein [bacterium]
MCDVDNCVVNADGNIFEEAQKTLTSIINVPGHAFYFGMMSHRPVMQVADIYRLMEIRPSSYLIGNRGAEVYSLSSDQFMVNQNIGALSAKRIYEELLRIAKHNPKVSFHITYDGV